MPNQTIAISLDWGATSADIRALNINQLGELIARQLSAAIRANVSFVEVLTNDPAAFTTQLIFNVPQNVFKQWDIGAGAYLAVSQFAVGDVKNSFVGGDSVSTGWIVLDGRTIASVTGLSANQLAALNQLFPSGTLPVVTPANVSGLPAGNAFGDIAWPVNLNPVVLPAAGTISPGLTFSNPVTDTEGQALATQTEVLRTSAQDAFDVTKQIQALCQQVLTALNNANPPVIYAKVFVGYAS